MTSSIKFQTQRADARVFLDHQQALQRLADSGQSWAHDALEDEGVLLFVSASGFKDSFWEVAADAAQPVTAWQLGDLF
jgi:hypothetical protein